MDFFETLEHLPPDPIFGLNLSFKKDVRKAKVNLGAGVYKTAELRPYILSVVKRAESMVLEQESSKDYLPIDGLHSYIEGSQRLLFGDVEERVYGAQTAGGTAALHIGGALIKQCGLSQIYLPNPTWANHTRIFSEAGLVVASYPYYDKVAHGMDEQRFFDALEKLPKNSALLLHACCHNPTGVDPTFEQWKEIANLMRKREILPFFDCAYQGFGEGLEEDAAPLRHFVESGMQLLVAVSHSKNFGLYAERTGALYVVGKDLKEAKRVATQVKPLIRGRYSNPPCHGARIVSTILETPHLHADWVIELTAMRERIAEMRKGLIERLAQTSDRFDFLEAQQGMFTYTDLNARQVARLMEEYGIYLPSDGRINIAGLNHNNMDYVADALTAVSL